MFFYDEDRKLLNDLVKNNESLMNKFLAQQDQISDLINLLKHKDINICAKPYGDKIRKVKPK